MIEFLSKLCTFVTIIGVAVAALLLFVYVRKGGMEGFKAHWKTTGDGAVYGIVGAVLAVVIFAVVAFWANKANADWFEETTIYGGIDYTRGTSPQCSSDPNFDRLTSNLGVRQHIVSINDISILANYTHHSCAVGVDRNTYDGGGLQVEWRIK